MSRLLILDNLHNTRDLGGMITKDGKRIKAGRLIRSGHLYDASETDLKKLSDIVDVIVDFRTDKEKNEKPDPIIDNTVYYHLPIIDSLTAGVTREKDADEKVISMLMMSPDKAKEYMCNTYIGFVGSEFPVSQYERFLRILLEDRDKAVLWHCTAGKDRAGFASVIIEEILGVDRELIIEDYLKTNEYLEADIESLMVMMHSMSGINTPEADRSLRYLFGASAEYLEALYNKIYDIYGGFEDFVINGLHISVEEQELLKKKYLER